MNIGLMVRTIDIGKRRRRREEKEDRLKER